MGSGGQRSGSYEAEVWSGGLAIASFYAGWKTWKPGNVREFDSCRGNVGDFTKSQVNVREVSGKSGLKPFIVSCIFASILDFAELMHFMLVSDHALLHSCPTTDNNTSTDVM